jgi:hypothetical protein
MRKLEKLDVVRVWAGKALEQGDGSYSNNPNVYTSAKMSPTFTSWVEMCPVSALTATQETPPATSR